MKHMVKFNEAKSKKAEISDKKAERASRKAEGKAKIAEIEEEMVGIEEEFGIIKQLSFDWKEISDEVYKEISDIVKELGGYLYDNPSYEGSDAIGFFVTKKPMTKSEVRHFSSLQDKIIDIEEKMFLDR